jgi:hypothetical protein
MDIFCRPLVLKSMQAKLERMIPIMWTWRTGLSLIIFEHFRLQLLMGHVLVILSARDCPVW